MDNVKCCDATGAPLKYLYQWDTNQCVKISGEIDYSANMEVHFCNANSDMALVVSPNIVGEYVVADIPNILLQQAKSVMVYLVQNPDSTTARTIVAARITVVPRPRPDDYVYTESDVLNYRTIDARLTAVEERLETSVDAETVKESVKEYFEENPVDIPTTLPNPMKITFSGAVEGEYDGSVETNIVIPTPPVIPETLPSPHSITFTGAVTGSYDGSAPVTVDIPEGGSGGGTGVYVGAEEPTDENIDLWVDTDEEASELISGGIIVESAEVGQTIVVKAVDENGKPTEWEAVDLPSGGSSEVRLIRTITLTKESNSIVIDTDTDGKPFELQKMIFKMSAIGASTSTGYASYQFYPNPVNAGAIRTGMGNGVGATNSRTESTAEIQIVGAATYFVRYGVGNQAIKQNVVTQANGKYTSIQSITLYFLTEDNFGVGTKLDVYGVSV